MLIVVITAVVVLAVLVVVLLLWRRRRAGTQHEGKPVDATALDALLREANNRLAASPQAGARSLDALPVLYVLGDANTAKTTCILKSGLEPELLAGQIYRDKDIVPTPVANIWYSGKTALIEMGEALRESPGLWTRLLIRTRPRAHRAAFKDAPFRAAVVCVSCEQFLGAPNTEAMQAAAARNGERLRQMARRLGASVPTYVLLTKLDRVPGFAEFVRNLSPEEAASLLGATPLLPAAHAGLFAEQAASAISASTDALVFSLGAARLDLLARETTPPTLAAAYEFPRELRRFRNLLTTYLVELARPSQLESNPYLRGFYFTGVRAVIRETVASAPVQAPTRPEAAADATAIFSSTPATAPMQPRAATGYAEKSAQWTFLPRFFPEAVLGDAAALAGTTQTQHASLFRRLLYGSAALLILLYLIAATVSWSRNAALEHAVTSASASLASSPASPGALASAQQLALLDSLRQNLVRLEDYRQNGAPLSYRWGLYHGNALLAPARQVYFAHFRELLLTPTQSNIVATLNALPPTAGATPAPGADYNSIYAALRAYLITTSNPDKSTVDFLPPVLLTHWQNGVPLNTALAGNEDQQQLAQRQFAFYAQELPRQNPFSIAPAGGAVTHARGYLASFGGFERIYQSMLTAADKAGPAINFNAQHPGSAETVVEPHVIEAAFTKPGYTFMQDALAHPARYFQGEAWVLGDQAPPTIDPATLKNQLAARYLADYLAQWRAFVRDARVTRYRSLQDAGVRLASLSGNNSALLALIYTVSHNTAVANPQIAAAFQAPQAVVPGGDAVQYIGATNKSYIDSLLALDGAINQVNQNPAGAADPTAAMPVSAAATAAHMAAQQSAQAFHIDAAGHLDAATLALLEAPITSVDALVHGLGPAQANAGGKSFCSAFNAVFAKVPFNPRATVQASPAEVAALLAPGSGSLWQFYNASLKSLLVQQGNEYVAAPNPPMQVNPAFRQFFSRAALLSQQLFPPGSTGLSLVFVLQNLPSPGIQNSAFKVDAQTLNSTDTSKQFNWSAQTASSASLTANGLPVSFTGPWSVFELVDKARAVKSGSAYELDFALEVANTPVKAPDGTPLVVRYQLLGPGADVLAPGALQNLRCVGTVAH